MRSPSKTPSNLPKALACTSSVSIVLGSIGCRGGLIERPWGGVKKAGAKCSVVSVVEAGVGWFLLERRVFSCLNAETNFKDAAHLCVRVFIQSFKWFKKP